MKPNRLWRWATVVALATGLGGCAVMRVDSQVESHAVWPSSALPTSATSYQFERLPSQQSPLQADLERAVSQELARHGWTVAGDASSPAAWRVAVSASHTVLSQAPWDTPSDRWRWGLGVDGGRRDRLNLGLWLSTEPPYHVRSVSVVVRDGQRGQVVYETRARHDGRWNDTPALWQAMVQAALSGFPVPPQGVRQVDIDLPR